ncbi:mitochondrial carrier protein, putative [Trypanosoma brucei gambiense DAL972]|uniref:Mitochondrial carrier protein, putative n=2 Tax=Trypanosoma brucei TaxID=5691 RepID=C9ZZ11_TRYB9|nr:mitochondrial carrier protein, putative [Trypanosoma brucei gambiense DAL972]RHW70113.1 mitochondrial carrier protein [Trypanosoma brucei equiperdum]CBH14660.1 mitochondrial carrier protein, putative [Trypanosoma brucei gambiense DAL972]|eukprot:XP_011776926.1 mitochondrial carrier protein, putative [Trypanosoma brucei gambiense DAL972]
MDATLHDKSTRQNTAPTCLSKAETKPSIHAAAGLLGASISTAMFYPLDALRTQMHVCKGGDVNQLSSLRQVIRQKGLRRLYAGFAVSVTSYGIGWGAYMAVFKSVQQNLSAYVSSNQIGGGSGSAKSGSVTAGCNVLSGCAAAITTGTVVTPLCVIRTRQQLFDGSNGAKPQNCWQGFKAIVENEGCGALMRGMIPQILIMGNTIIQMAIYEELRHYIVEQKIQPTSFDVALISSVSKAVASALFNPIEVVRTRLQDKRNCTSPEYRSMTVGLRTIWRTEGIRGLYRGVWVNLCRVVPTTSVSFILYEKFLAILSHHNARRAACLPLVAD